jgi:hypothetical protein
LAIPVLLVLAVLWAAVLVPPVLRSRNENRRGGAIGDLTHRLGALTARPASGTRRPAGVVRPAGPARAGSTHPARYAGRLRPGGAARPVRTPARPVAATAARTMTPAQKRRRDVLISLGAAAAVTLLLAIALRMPVLWVLHLLADTLLGVYVYLLVQLKQRGSLVGPPAGYTPHTARVDLRHPEPAPRPELAPVPHHALRRTASS